MAQRTDTRRIVIGEEDERAEKARARNAAKVAGERFGGIDVGAFLAGMLGGFGLTVILGGIAAGIGTVGYQADLERDAGRLGAGGVLAGLVILAVSFLVGGWIAGRMARYDGGRNGLLAGVCFVVLVGVLALVGAWQGDQANVLDDIQIPRWFSENDNATLLSVLSGVAAAALVLVAAFAGGLAGARSHRAADRAILDSQEPITRRRVEEMRVDDDDAIDLRDRASDRTDDDRHPDLGGTPNPGTPRRSDDDATNPTVTSRRLDR